MKPFNLPFCVFLALLPLGSLAALDVPPGDLAKIQQKLMLAGLAELPHAEALTVAEECARDSSLQAEATLAIEKIRKALGQTTGGKP
ncbi:MAG: hypothetical protein NT154_15840 [Verrucomicrobia bacterium]|nr:hypothetical protein [Verrucomicrobiota bacterium]